MKQIVCEIQLFDLNQVISAVDDKGISYFAISSTLDDLSQDIVDLCQKERIKKVHLFGNASYVDQIIVPAIHEYNKANYQLENIEVEIN